MNNEAPASPRGALSEAQQSPNDAVVTRRTFGYINWSLRPNREPDAPPTVFRFRCLTESEDSEPCGAESDESENFAVARDWTYGHMRAHPTHVSYAEVLVRPWVMWRLGPAR